MAKKEITEEIEFFVPQKLDVNYYLNQVIPSKTNEKKEKIRKQAIHHLARYEWAGRVLKKTKPGIVLDIACGAGYGSYMLAEALPKHKIIGGDYDPRAVEYAKKHYGKLRNLKFDNIDAVTWLNLDKNIHAGRFDYIVSFDTIEHLLHREICLINFSEFLSPDGLLLLSTPVKLEILLNPGWAQHKIEYSDQHLFNLMRRFFKTVKIPDNRSLPELDFWESVINKGEQRYRLIGNPMVCSKPIALGLNVYSKHILSKLKLMFNRT